MRLCVLRDAEVETVIVPTYDFWAALGNRNLRGCASLAQRSFCGNRQADCAVCRLRT